MSETVKLNNCPKCGAPIPATAPQGLCPKCVLAGAALATESGAGATATGEIPSLERVSAAFPQLEILELIGRGGMGFVFKARQPHLERFVALKLLPDKLAKDPHFAERFNREGRVLARLNHPGIVSVYDFGQTGGFYFLLMEYVDGVNLRQAMHAGRFSPGEALGIVPKICEALQYAHEQGILHRDIKPENILLDAKGRVKIADFGIAKLVGEAPNEMTLTGTGAALGTPHYMAPEQLEKPSTVDHRADIYSLGVVFYEMLTGELPIGRFAAPSSKTPVGSGVDDVVFRTLEKDRERRFQSAGEVQATVEHLTSSGAAAAGSSQSGIEPDPDPEARRSVSRPAKGLLVAGIFNWVGSIAIVGGLAYFAAGRESLLSPAQLGVTCLLMLTLSSLVMVGAWKMMRLESYRLAILGSVLAMITSPGSLIGLPIGLWALLTLRQPAVRAAFRHSARWASHQPIGERRGVLKWAFIGAIAVGMGVVMMINPRSTRDSSRPQSIVGGASVAEETRANPAPIQANFRIPKGQVVTFEVLRRDVDPPVPIRAFAGFLVAPDEERGRCSILMKPEPTLSGTNSLVWRIRAVSDDGAGASGPTAELGELISLLPTNHLHSIEPDSSFEITLTRPGSDGQTNAMLSLAVVSRARGKIGPAMEHTLVAMGSTNWAQSLRERKLAKPAPPAQPGEVLAAHWLKSPVGTNTTNSIRFTFTRVELREEDGKPWLAMDYDTHIRGDCEPIFTVDANGFTPVTRKTGLLITPEDSPAVLRQEIQWLVPPGVPADTLRQFRDSVDQALVGKSFVIPEGEQRPLLRFPVGKVGDLSVGIGAKRSLPKPAQDALRTLERAREDLQRRERELSAQFTAENGLVQEARRKLSEMDEQIAQLQTSPGSSRTNTTAPPPSGAGASNPGKP